MGLIFGLISMKLAGKISVVGDVYKNHSVCTYGSEDENAVRESLVAFVQDKLRTHPVLAKTKTNIEKVSFRKDRENHLEAELIITYLIMNIKPLIENETLNGVHEKLFS
ncbi:hypothetical protein CRM22_003274 [Opisthorchis felineus]|uniref:Uncharacterized protein n=1 Tax=Opisthorchis felineus TaxID=147828 RepID=A0A4V3SFZ0_OPIFE|nr:hypothetical protein CRM22_003274 [Opisthorchis felineus]